MTKAWLSERDMALAMKHGVVDADEIKFTAKGLASFLAERFIDQNLPVAPSRVEFLRGWWMDKLDYPLVPCRSSDLYGAYVEWCRKLKRQPDDMTTFIKEVKKFGFTKRRVRLGEDQSTVILPPGTWVSIPQWVEVFRTEWAYGEKE